MMEEMGTPAWVDLLLRDSSALASFYADILNRTAKDSGKVVDLLIEGKRDEATSLAGKVRAYQELASNVTAYQREAQQQAEFAQETRRGG